MKNFIVSYKRSDVFQTMIVKAENIDSAEEFFKRYKADAVLYGLREQANINEEQRKGMPIVVAR